MKRQLIVFTFLIFSVTMINAQEKPSAKNKFRVFSQTNLNYVFGINETTLSQKTNSLHVKLVVGLSNKRTGFGIGLENASYRASGSKGLSFEMLSFSGNIHLLAKPITTNELNYFIKGAAGYGPRIFRSYNKGFSYEASGGVMLTTKRKSRYFLQAIYHYQEINGFSLSLGKPQIKGVGLGIGTWF